LAYTSKSPWFEILATPKPQPNEFQGHLTAPTELEHHPRLYDCRLQYCQLLPIPATLTNQFLSTNEPLPSYASNDPPLAHTEMSSGHMTKALLEARFSSFKAYQCAYSTPLCQYFPSVGDLVVIGLSYTNDLATDCVLLEYANTTGFLLLRDEHNKVLSPGDLKVAYARRANKDSGIYCGTYKS
jgi:hypothetical protein